MPVGTVRSAITHGLYNDVLRLRVKEDQITPYQNTGA